MATKKQPVHAIYSRSGGVPVAVAHDGTDASKRPTARYVGAEVASTLQRHYGLETITVESENADRESPTAARTA